MRTTPFIVNNAGYKKANKLYNRHVGMSIGCVKDAEVINDFLLVPPDSDWRMYKNRVLIFRPRYKIASFVITPYIIYNPISVCCEQYYEQYDETYMSYLLYLKIFYKTYYWKDIQTFKWKIPTKQSEYIINLQNDLKNNLIWCVIYD